MSLLRNIITFVLCLGGTAGAQMTNSSMSVADAFLCTGSANYQGGADLTGLNFGAAGTLAIAPASSAKGEFRSVLRFNLSNSVAVFNAAYGSNRWTVAGLALELTSNYGTAGVQPNNPIFNVINGGRFVIAWLANDYWVEGTGTPSLPTTDGVGWNSLPDLLAGPGAVLATNTYVPPGNNVPVVWPLPLETHLLADVTSGGDVSLYFYAADESVAYLFNSYKYGRGNEPLLQVVALPVLQLLSGAFTNGVFRLTGLGGNSTAYQIQMNADLATTNWRTIGTGTTDPNGYLQFDDAGATNAPRFYRLSQ